MSGRENVWAGQIPAQNLAGSDQAFFGAKAIHQPSGSIVPETILQDAGASKFTHVLHLLPSLGVF